MIYPYQRKVAEELSRAFKVHHISRKHNLPVQPRTHTLIVGPTGSGKTWIAKELARRLNWGVFVVNASGWIVQGAKQEATFSALMNWVSRQPKCRPLCIIIDEVDKADSEDQGWWRALKAELYSLLDGVIPPGDYTVNTDSDKPEEIAKLANESELRIKNAMIIGCGAFQSIHDSAAKSSMGFVQDPRDVDCSHDKLSTLLQRELVNRFGQVLQLPTPAADDYQAMFDEILAIAPTAVVEESKLVMPGFVNESVKNKLGARSVEVLLYRIYSKLAEGDELRPWSEPVDFDPWDVPIVDNHDIDAGGPEW